MWKVMLAVAASAVVAATLGPQEASARHRHSVVVRHVGGMAGWSAADFCGGRLPAYGTDACGNREFSYGPGCFRRAVIYTPDGPVGQQVRTCR